MNWPVYAEVRQPAPGERARSDASRHIDKRAGRVGRLLRRQPKDGVGDFMGVTAAFHGNSLANPFDTIRFSARRVNLGYDGARSNRVYPNPVGRSTSLASPMVNVSIAPFDAA
jgi:hypothetical protein